MAITAALVTVVDLACGMAKLSVMPVVPMSSRAMNALMSSSASWAMPCSTAFFETKVRSSSREAKDSPTKTCSGFTKSVVCGACAAGAAFTEAVAVPAVSSTGCSASFLAFLS